MIQVIVVNRISGGKKMDTWAQRAKMTLKGGHNHVSLYILLGNEKK